jgi:hypothetical protein
LTTTHNVYDERSKLSLVLYATRIVQRKLTSEQDRHVSQKRSKKYVPQTLSLSPSPYMATVTTFGPLYSTFRVAFFLTANFPSRRLDLSDARSSLQTLFAIVPILRIWSCMPCPPLMLEILSLFSSPHHPHCSLSFLILYLSLVESSKESHTLRSLTFHYSSSALLLGIHKPIMFFSCFIS